MMLHRSKFDRNRGGILSFNPTQFIPILAVATLLFSYSVSFAQDDNPDAAPPPLKQISKGEKEQLAAKTEIKERTVLALQLMDSRIRNAEKLSSERAFPEMYSELGGFHALVENTLNFLLTSGPADGKVLNNLKRFEIGLRSFSPRIETMRRESPDNLEPYIKYLLKYLSQTREKAIEPFYSNTVGPNIRNP